MNILLDTHMLIWALDRSPRLSEKAKTIICDSDNDIYFSVVSLWEIEMKRLAKPESLPITALEIYNYCKEANYKILTLQEQSIFKLANLSRPESEPPHKDPFDRILICQAISNDMKFLTHDSLIKGYTSDNIVFV